MKSLRQADIGERVTIKKVEGQGPFKRRILDMGLTKGTELFVRKVAPLGDPIQVSLRGYELTIRKDDAENILVEEV
ncbi:ferrous iron transport protein A [uncultured Anaerococcus sp.]|uniref:FeoA family protein n=1 Tax=uncultured Anaerococcus sp. TaxID=293428 RepID=UPI0026078D60|nr:ferrous iron transport protein A [uncultured Anaerococcus sp.]